MDLAGLQLRSEKPTKRLITLVLCHHAKNLHGLSETLRPIVDRKMDLTGLQLRSE